MSTTLTVRIDDETKQKLERLADSTARSKSYLVASAIREYIDVNEWQIREIRQTIEEADRPGARFLDHGEINAKWGAKRAHPVDGKGRKKSR